MTDLTVEALTEYLKKYGDHIGNGAYDGWGCRWDDKRYGCTCGWDDIRAKLYEDDVALVEQNFGPTILHGDV